MIAAIVKINWLPVLRKFWIPSLLVIEWVDIAKEIPATTCIAVQRISLSVTLFPLITLRLTGGEWYRFSRLEIEPYMHPIFDCCKHGRCTGAAVLLRRIIINIWKNYRKLTICNRQSTVTLNVNNRYRSTPIALSTDQPVTHLERNL